MINNKTIIVSAAIALASLSPPSNDHIDGGDSSSSSLVYEHLSTPFFGGLSTLGETFDYIEDKTSLRELALILSEDSRRFTDDEAKSYSNFIDDFFV
ncbi:hypothetical protein [Desulfuromonas thiophila]|uniref:hypothetical protein n=1 Tax=Desulfuromonas thiophila TaxID=57664 RepID=UPI00115FD35C|nr:hypothetical protein [Desulfuromonas thiophila]